MADEISGDRGDDDGRRESLEALTRIGAGTWWRTARWSVDTSLKLGSRLVGVVDPEHRVARAVSDLLGDPDWLSRTQPTPPPSLRERGQLLLTESADVNYEAGSHPAYERILADLAPDEA